MNTIGIIGAMDEEIDSLKTKMDIVTVRKTINLDFYIGRMHGKNVTLVRSGIGKVNAAICAQVLIDLYAVDCIINTGAAGAISNELNIGDIVVSSDLVHHDFDCRLAGDYKIGDIPRMVQSYFKADEQLLKIAKEACQDVLTDNKICIERIATGDQFISSKEVKMAIWNQFKAYCAEMEGAAIAQTCYLNNVPFVVVRSISDKADESAHISFDKFVQIAAKNSSQIVQCMIKNL